MNAPLELVVLSGKGGTGKTSLTAAFAMFANNTIVADGDVDAANLHLLLDPTPRRTGEFVGGHEASIRTADCTSCGKCIELCRFGAIEEVDGWPTITHCEGCGVCVAFCPSGAIDWTPATTGSWMVSDSRAGILVHARLRPGAENSGKLVAMVRDLAREEATKSHAGTILVDGPPGIGCPAIASLSGTHAAVIVTEPTPSGIHDLQRVLDLCAHFRVRAGIVVNKADLNNDATTTIGVLATERGLPLLGTLPYDPLFTDAQRAGLPVPLFQPNHSLTARLQTLWTAVETWSRTPR